jgi:hypothetical protein
MAPVPPRRPLGRLLAKAAGLLAIGYASASGYLILNERALIYQPADRQVAAAPPQLGLREQRVTYPSTDGVTLSAWTIPAAGDRLSDWWLLICHGNLGNIGFAPRPAFYARLRDVGINLLAFDYRGFGDSTGSPDEQGLYADATASYDYLTRTRGVPPERLVIFGHSLGSGVAIELVSRVPAAGLIVEGAFTSIVDRAQELYPMFPVAIIASQRFPSLDRIQTIDTPKLFLHSPDDAIIPYAHGRRLFEAARPPRRLVNVKGGHDNAFRVDGDVYFGAIEQFLLEITPESRREAAGQPR